MNEDVQVLVQENTITTDDNKAEFLMADYFVSTLSAVDFEVLHRVGLRLLSSFPEVTSRSQVHHLL